MDSTFVFASFLLGWVIAWWCRGALGEMAEERRLEATQQRAIAANELETARSVREPLKTLEAAALSGDSRVGWLVADGRRLFDQHVAAAKESDLIAALLELEAESLRRRPLRFVARNALRALRARVTREEGGDHA